jgi:serine/threonine-protein kinase
MTRVETTSPELTVDDWRTAFRLLDSALELPAHARHSWVDALDGADARLAPTLRALLEKHAALDADFLVTLPDFTRAGPADDDDDVALGDLFGPYRVLERIGRGGMGTVWLAERHDGLVTRRVALKLARPGTGGPEFAAQLARERELLATLEHPGIARLYETGIADDGRAWIALEYVSGMAIDRWCELQPADLRRRVELLRDVAATVAYAHSRLVLHCDLKPANILVDGEGRVRLLDFGIGQLLAGAQASPGIEPAAPTAQPLTPDYASPEQWRGAATTTATDVYSLGVVAYELITGRRPSRADVHPHPDAENESSAAEPDLVAPSLASQTLPKTRRPDRDLDAIVLRALAHDPAERYPTAAALADELGRWLHGEVVMARRGSAWHRSMKFARRHRAGVAAAAIAVLAVVAGGATALWQASEARMAAKIAQREATRARAVQEFLVSIFADSSRDSPDPERARATTVRELLDRSAARLQTPGAGGLPDAAQDELQDTFAGLYNALGLSESAMPLLRARETRLRAAGPTRETDLARVLVAIGRTLQHSTQFDDALPVLREAETLALRHPDDVLLNGYVASFLANQLVNSAPAEATHHAQRAVDLLSRTAPDSVELLGALLMLANNSRYTDPEGAVQAAARAVAITARTQSSDSQLYAEMALLLADLQGASLRATEAERTFLAAEKAALHSTPPGHYVRLQIDLRYGLLLADMDRPAEADSRLQRALALTLKSFGPDDPNWVPWAHENLARAALRADRLPDAALHSAAILRVLQRGKPNDVLAKNSELACDIALRQGDVERARQLIAEARAARGQTGTIEQAGFREGVRLREAAVALASGDLMTARQGFAEASVATPDIQRFIEVRLQAELGAAEVAHQSGDDAGAKAAANRVLAEIARRGEPPALRPFVTAARRYAPAS